MVGRLVTDNDKTLCESLCDNRKKTASNIVCSFIALVYESNYNMKEIVHI